MPPISQRRSWANTLTCSDDLPLSQYTCYLLSMLEIRQATLAEMNIAIGILAEAARWLASRGLPSWNPDTLPAVMNVSLTRGDVYLAWINDQPVGTITVQWSDVLYWGERPDDAGYIHKLAIVRSAAGQHLGAQLLPWAESLIAERGRHYARLDCHASNPMINAFYEAAGYQLRGTLTFPEVALNLREKLLG